MDRPGSTPRRSSSRSSWSSLDPVTLAVQANVPTVCSESGFTLFAAVGDERSGSSIPRGQMRMATAPTSGASTRRRTRSTPAAGSIELPNLTPFLGNPTSSAVFAGTSDGLIYGDARQRLYRLSAGAGSFDQLGVPPDGRGLYPAGQGAWRQSAIGDSSDPVGTASFFTGGWTFDAEVAITGDLVGADDSAVYAAEDDEADQLSRYPTDRGSPSLLMTSGFVPNGFGGQMRLLYRDLQGPLLVGNDVVVKLWLVPSATGDEPGSLMMQSAPLP